MTFYSLVVTPRKRRRRRRFKARGPFLRDLYSLTVFFYGPTRNVIDEQL